MKRTKAGRINLFQPIFYLYLSISILNNGGKSVKMLVKQMNQGKILIHDHRMAVAELVEALDACATIMT